MAADYNHNLPVEAYAASLRYELSQASLPRERKAAIVAELERIGGRNGLEDRSDVETAGQAVAGPQAPSVVEVTGPESAEARRARHADSPAGFDGR